MRIAMIHNRYGASARGGAERVVERLVAALQERGHEVIVATCGGRPNARHITHAAAHAICHLRVPNIVAFDHLNRLPVPLRVIWHLMDLLNLPSAWLLARLLKRVRPDVVHTHNLIGCGGFTPWVIRRSGIPWVHTLHDVQLITPSGLLVERGISESVPPLGVRGGACPPKLQRRREGELRADRNPSQPPLTLRGGDGRAFGRHYLERSVFGHWFRTLRRSLFGSPAIVTSPSRWLLEIHRGYGFFPRSRDAVIGNPIDVATTPTHSPSHWEREKERRSFSPSTRSGWGAPARRSLARPSEPWRSGGEGGRWGGAVRRFLFVGQIEGAKGILVLVEAFRQLRALYDDVTLHVVGDGALSPTLKRMSRDIRGLILRGRLDADGVRMALAESDVLVVPSLCAENQPSTILEAYAVGIPVIAARVGGIPEIVRLSSHEATEGRSDGETGFLMDPGSVEDLLRYLRACVEDPKRVRAMTAACRTVALEHATERIAIQFEEVYTAVSEYAYPASRQPMGSLREG